MAAIDFPTATSNGQTFAADTGVIYTYIGSPPNGFWSGTFSTTGLSVLDGRYIAKNDGNSIQTLSTQGLKFNNGTTDSIVLDSVNGKVGIGESDPNSYNIYVDNLVIKGPAHEGITIKSGNLNSGNIWFSDVAAEGRGRIQYHHMTDHFDFNTAGSSTAALRIDSAGKIGIGTVTPQTKLDVNGTITASGISSNLTGNVTGNADTATKLATARTINGVSFDGTANITLSVGTNANQGLDTSDSVAFAGISGPLTGNVTGNVTGNLTGNVTGNVTGDVTGDVTGNADTATSATSATSATTATTATRLGTPRTINGTSFDGTADIVVGSIPQNAQTSGYTLVLADAGKHISITTGGITIPSGVFSVGDAVSIYNNSTANQTITATAVTLRLAGTALTGNRTLTQRGLCTILCVATNEFVISGVGVS